MHAAQRREEIKQMLCAAQSPLSASNIALRFAVSRQVIVGDIALMRAGGLHILATPRGYLLQKQENETAYFEGTIVCVHSAAQLAEEIYAIIDHGGALLDVTVEHSIYGEICAPLHLYCRADADAFLKKVKDEQAHPLSALTGGVHLHRVRCADKETFERITHVLQDKKLLFEREEA